MNILVTGGAGFIGSNFINHMLSTYNYTIINLDLLTYAGNLNNLKDVSENPDYHFIQGDISNKELVKDLFQRFDIDVVINFAAESHVDRSIVDPSLFFRTNLLGTETLLEVAKDNWMIDPTNKRSKDYKENVKFIQISTDEVYGTLEKDGYFVEESNLAPNSPYSASKASADMIVRAYHATYGLPVLITRCSNNYGPYQYPEKLIPLIIDHALKNQPIPIYGDGKQVRDWLYVEDHCRAIDTVLHSGQLGEIYNIGGNNEKENIEIVKIILNYLGKSESLISYVSDRLGHDRRYAIDNSKITNELDWSPAYTFEEGVKLTIDWYLSNVDWIKSITYDNKAANL